MQTLEDFKKNLSHAYVAYLYAFEAVPPDAEFQHGDVKVGKFKFLNVEQAVSMRVELGWAFFVRMDAVLERFLENCGQDTRGTKVLDVLLASGKLSERELEGARQYRDLRNTLHHDDGVPDPMKRKNLNVSPGHEPHIFSAEMENWNKLFIRIAEIVWELRSSLSDG